MVDFNYFDVTIAAIVLILGIKGFIHGFVKEVFGLIGLVAGVYFASRLAGTAADFIETNFLHLENAALLKLLGFLAILVMIWLGATILGAIFSKLSDSNPGIVSRFLGFLSGAAKYFIIFALIVTALSHVQLAKDKLQKYVEHSRLYPYLIQTGSLLIHMETPQKQRVQKEDANLTAPAAAAVSTEHNTTENNTSSASVSEGS
jgi:membrane protein required for colicin V production